MAKPAGPQHEAFTAWAKERGVTINGVRPTEMPGRGLGIVAERHIEAGEEIVNVPSSALLTELSIPVDFRDKYEDITIHGLLASYLASKHPQLEQYKSWAATWPTPDDLKRCMPMLWPDGLRMRMDVNEIWRNPCSILPPAIGCGAWAHPSLMGWREDMGPGLLKKQETKFEKDLAIVQRVIPNIDVDWYRYCWLIVNTRTFYYEVPGLKEKRSREDCLVMCPFADYFNHADNGCDVAFDEKDYTVTADRDYELGEEVFVSYGSHSNDFLLVEYGFVLDKNKWDYVPVDDMLAPNVLDHKLRRNMLERVGYLGNYTLTEEGVCHRTQVAVRGLLLGNKDFQRFVDGKEMSERDQVQADKFITNKIFFVYKWEAEEALKALEQLHDVEIQFQRQMLTQRWTQIRYLVQKAEDNSIDPEIVEFVEFLQ